LQVPGGDGTNLDSWIVTKVNRPTITLNEQEHAFLNHTFYYPGRVTYSEVSFTLVDPVDVDAAWRILKLIEKSGYTIPTTNGVANQLPASLSTVSKKKSVAALESFTLVQIDAEGNEWEKWTFVNPWIKEIAFSELSYEEDSLTTIDVQMRFDRCIYDPDGRSDRDTLFDTNL
jgi:hypothetical protein